MPKQYADAVTENMRARTGALTLADVTVPRELQGDHPGQPSAQDWLDQTKAAPRWLTQGQTVRLMDIKNRYVRNAQGGWVEVPFTMPMPANPRGPAFPAFSPVLPF